MNLGPGPASLSLSALLLLVSACGSAEADQPVLPPQELANRIDDIAIGKAPPPPKRLAFLLESDLGPEFRDRPTCRLSSDGKLLLVVANSGAVARVDGKRVPLAVAGPVGPTGGFFEAPGVTISVGRSAPLVEEAESYARPWSAGATVGGARDKPAEKIEASWTCTR